VRQSAFRVSLVITLLALGAVAQEAPKPPEPEWKFALHGFLGGSLYAADGFMAPSPGQQTLWAAGADHGISHAVGALQVQAVGSIQRRARHNRAVGVRGRQFALLTLF